MGTSAKKKREKKQDFQKPKLKVGKARPKNTNATDTSFAAQSIVLKQQNLSASGRDAPALFKHNLSLLSSKSETQRKDALIYLTVAIATSPDPLPQPPSIILSKVQPLILDGNTAVRAQVLKLFHTLPKTQLGALDQVLLYTRAGMTHLSSDIRLSALEILHWLVDVGGEAVVSGAGNWVKTLQTFQNLLSWHDDNGSNRNGNAAVGGVGNWTAAKPATTSSTKLGSSKLLVRQLSTLARFLTAGLTRRAAVPGLQARKAAAAFPLWAQDAYLLPRRSNVFGYLNLFGAPRDVESEVYDDPEERVEIMVELGIHRAFERGVKDVKREGGEVGRAAAMVEKALKLVGDMGG